MSNSVKPNEPCLCCSGKTFAKCCEPYLTFKEKPKTVKQLMRSRYTAYALGAGKHREYLIKTWHPATARQISIADLTNDDYLWTGLEIIDDQQKGDLGKVEFKASFQDAEGLEYIHHEKSIFHRDHGVWLYLEGDVKEE